MPELRIIPLESLPLDFTAKTPILSFTSNLVSDALDNEFISALNETNSPLLPESGILASGSSVETSVLPHELKNKKPELTIRPKIKFYCFLVNVFFI